MFKETFNTDKSRLDKRQTKLNLPQDFAIIMLVNVHKVDSDGKSKSKTAGKYMVYAKGTCKDKFLGDGIKYSKDQFYVHKNKKNKKRLLKLTEDFKIMTTMLHSRR